MAEFRNRAHVYRSDYRLRGRKEGEKGIKGKKLILTVEIEFSLIKGPLC